MTILYMEFILHNLWNFSYYLLSFVLVISLIVFVHELGHYIVAKICKVKIEVFSIGFGKEIFGFYDKSGTRWKFSMIPAGGYVKMFGDTNEASVENEKYLSSIPEEEKELTFHFKKLHQKTSIVIAGPLANFLLSILILSFLYAFYGKPYTPPIIGKTIEKGVAQNAGLIEGDKIISINGEQVSTFDDIIRIISTNSEKEISLFYEREGTINHTILIPELTTSKDIFGNTIKSPQIGISISTIEYRYMSIPTSIYVSIIEIKKIIQTTCKVLWQMIRGKRNLDDLGGPIRIVKYSGQSMKKGIIFTLWFIAMLSVNVGFINLLPIPVLDGGHLLYYIIESISNKNFAAKYQNYSIKAGITIIFIILALTTFNDVKMLFL
ncbi:MAG: RIP metalloprotease RseP [Rickettsiaceae bacterium H1]|nr:RIP metalloprotease RseP [Rickettsiaceae bacterium H1]